MLKKIDVQDARLGMFVHELCGRWMDHPFWKKAFLLDKQKDLDSLQSCGIEEIWIDTGKGLDVEPEPIPAKEEAAIAPQEAAAPPKKTEPRLALHEESQRAQRIHAKANETVALVFEKAQIGKVLPIDEAITMVDEINQTVSRNSGALLNLTRLKSRNDHVYQHSVAVCSLMIALGRQMGMQGEILKYLGMAGLLHDIGTVGISYELLNKPDRLTDDEFNIIKTHPQRGWEILGASQDMDEMILDVCRHHHERIDGTGYPDKLSGDDLSLFARMASVCDVYDSMISGRSFKKAATPADAIRKMTELLDGQLDQAVFRAFVKTVGIYPTGTLVKLKSGRLAVVSDQTTKSLATPVVKVFFSTKVNEPVPPTLVDLSKMPDAIVSVENPDDWKFDLKAMTGI